MTFDFALVVDDIVSRVVGCRSVIPVAHCCQISDPLGSAMMLYLHQVACWSQRLTPSLCLACSSLITPLWERKAQRPSGTLQHVQFMLIDDLGEPSYLYATHDAAVDAFQLPF
jgi:hypothetical protein